MGQVSGGGVTIGGVFGHSPRNHCVEGWRQGGVALHGAGDGGVQMHQDDLEQIVGDKGQAAGQHLKEDHAEGIDVGAIVDFAGGLFR